MGERKKLDYDAFLARGAYDSFDIQYCLDRLIEADRAFQEADALLQATEDITGIDYASQSDRFYRILDAYGKLRRFMNRYVEEVWDVDKEFYSAIANGPAEALSHVRLEDIKIPNTLGLSNHDARAGTDILLSHLSIKNFIQEPEALNNNYVKGFAELFQEEVELAGETMTLKEFLEELENAATYSNDIHKPWLEALSVLLNMASFGVKPLYECICGYDIITGEQLSTGERVWTGVEAVLDFLPVFGVAKAAEQGLVKALGAETVNGIENRLREGVVRNAVEGGIYSNSTFASNELLVSHFEKHKKEFKGIYHTADEYLQGARDVMNNGYKVEYWYNEEMRIGFVQFMGNNSKGRAKFAFVGTNNNGYITTFHTESGKSFWKMLNRENIPVINPK